GGRGFLGLTGTAVAFPRGRYNWRGRRPPAGNQLSIIWQYPPPSIMHCACPALAHETKNAEFGGYGTRLETTAGLPAVPGRTGTGLWELALLAGFLLHCRRADAAVASPRARSAT